MKPSPEERASQFRKIIEEQGLTVACCQTNGTDVKAACGQMKYGLRGSA